jgi:1-acyl-sn-glycerol-3-phosphate acyltransferase
VSELPPYWFRRLVLAPVFVLGTVALFTTLPLWAAVAAFASRIVPGRWRILRVAWFLFVYLFFESVMLVVLFVLWIASGFGWKIRSPRFEDLHYALAAWWLRRVMGSARRTFNLVIERDDQDDTPVEQTDAPLIVFSRHAGPGDSFLLIDALLNRSQRRPRIVLKDLLQFDPCVDVVLNRLPNRFIPSKGRAGNVVIDSIVELSGGMGPGDAFVLFPEGGNFTPARHARAIEKLEEIGRPGLADQARQMHHVLPPKPTGALTAIAAAPTARIVFVGHVGLEELSTMKDLWRGIPMDANVVSRLWSVTADQVPPEPEREQWLYDHWKQMDEWIDSRGIADADIGDPDPPTATSQES